MRRRIQKHPAGNPCVHKDVAWGDLQHGSGESTMGTGLGGVSLIILVRRKG